MVRGSENVVTVIKRLDRKITINSIAIAALAFRVLRLHKKK